jgi:hypothetical protein
MKGYLGVFSDGFVDLNGMYNKSTSILDLYLLKNWIKSEKQQSRGGTGMFITVTNAAEIVLG